MDESLSMYFTLLKLNFRSAEICFLGLESLLIVCFLCRKDLVFSWCFFLFCMFCDNSNPDFLRKLELGGSSASSRSSEEEN